MPEVQETGLTEIPCSSCGVKIKKAVPFCQTCGAHTKKAMSAAFGELSERDWFTALLLCVFLGVLGAHRFYVRKIKTGMLMLLTLGGLGIWALIDVITICTGKFKDTSGRVLAKKNG
jgi:hypothetical protein